jgi:hypothetical protein
VNNRVGNGAFRRSGLFMVLDFQGLYFLFFLFSFFFFKIYIYIYIYILKIWSNSIHAFSIGFGLVYRSISELGS